MGKSPKQGQPAQGPAVAAKAPPVMVPGTRGLAGPLEPALPGPAKPQMQGAGGITDQERMALAQMMARNQGQTRRWAEGGGARGGGSGSSNRGGYGSSGRGTGMGGWG